MKLTIENVEFYNMLWDEWNRYKNGNENKKLQYKQR